MTFETLLLITYIYIQCDEVTFKIYFCVYFWKVFYVMGVFKTTRTETRDFNTETAAIRENCVRCFYSKSLRLKAKKKKDGRNIQ